MVKTFTYKNFTVSRMFKQWYSYDFGGSFFSLQEFCQYVDGRIARKNLKKYKYA